MHIFCAKFAPYEEMRWCSDIKSMLRLSANAAAAGSQKCRFMTRGNAAVKRIHWSLHVLINALQALV